jgi:hypothetical protein
LYGRIAGVDLKNRAVLVTGADIVPKPTSSDEACSN